MPHNNLVKKILPVVQMVYIAAAGSIPLMTHAEGDANAAAGIQNPIGVDYLSTLIANVINYVLGIGAVLALLALVVGGVKIILGFTSEKQVEQGKEVIKWAIIGLLVMGLSFVIITTITSKILKI